MDESTESVTTDQIAYAGFAGEPVGPSHNELVSGRVWGIVPEVLAEIASHTTILASETGSVPEASVASAPRAQGLAAGAGVAVIPLSGVITPRGSLFARLFGLASGLEGFRSNVREALADDNVSAIVIDVDSPGGTIDMVPETAAELFAARGQGKPIVAVCNTLCASAAYWIACQADEVVVTPSGQVGSIGVFTVLKDVSKLQAAMGIKTTIVSAGRFKTEGNPYEPLSKEGVASVQSNVDDLYAMFVGDIANARGVPVQAVQAGYGEGRVLLAGQALQVKMVDSIETLEQVVARLGGEASAEPEPADDDELLSDDIDDDETEAAAPLDDDNESPEALTATPALEASVEDQLTTPARKRSAGLLGGATRPSGRLPRRSPRPDGRLGSTPSRPSGQIGASRS